MKITQLLAESDSLDFEDFIIQMARECSDALNNDLVLYRGMSSGGRAFGRHSIRTDRVSASAKYMETAIFNAAFAKLHEIDDVRNKSMFASTSWRDANQYGHLHYVFPINGSKLIYAPGIDDSIQLLNGWHSFTRRVGQLDPSPTNEEVKSVEDFLDTIERTRVVNSTQLKALVEQLPDRVKQCFGNTVYEQTRVINRFRVSTPSLTSIEDIVTSDNGTEVMVVAPHFYAISADYIKALYGQDVDYIMDSIRTIARKRS